MTRETYRKMTGYFLQDEKKVRRIILANRLLTGIVFVSYPLYLISLLLKRDTVFVIAVTVFVRNPVAGCILAMIGIMIAVIRVIGGVHTVWDVTAGAAVGILSGVIGYYMLPYRGF